jgi:hypothetical protein
LNDIEFIGRCVNFDSSSTLYKELSNYCFSKNTDLEIEKRLSDELRKCSSKKSILISDEWFTSDYSGLYSYYGASWQHKIKKISRIVHELDHKVLISIRNPTEAISSQYYEFLATGLSSKYQNLEEYAFSSNDSLIFDYSNTHFFLEDRFTSVTYLTFESVKNGTYQEVLKSFFDVSSIPKISKDNVKLRNKNFVIVKRSDLIHRIINLTPPSLKKGLKNIKALNVMIHFMLKVFQTKKKITPMKNQENKCIKVELKNATKFYENLLKSDIKP